MNEKEIRALGFEPWYGGDEAPGDWDGGKTLFRDGIVCPGQGVSWWTHDGSDEDVIGYEKKETPMEYPEWVYARAHKLSADYPALCQHILDHEQPPVDPDLELARKHYLEWSGSSSLTVEDAILAAIKESRNA